MYTSLTMLACGSAQEAQDRPHLARLVRHRTLTPILMAVCYGGIVLVALGAVIVGTVTHDFPRAGYVVAAVFGILFFTRARGRWRAAQGDTLRRCLLSPEQYAFVDGKITKAETRMEGSGNQAYEVVDAIIHYADPSSHEKLETSETFPKTIWNFEHSQFPIPVQLAVCREDPEDAELVGIAKSAVDAIPKGKKRDSGGAGLSIVMVGLVTLLMVGFFLVSLAMAWDKMRGHGH